MNQKTINIFELPTHPAADVFPMLPDDELEELAQDIATNGLQQPLVIADVDGETVLVDGRNRREACRRTDVEPRMTELNGQDPTAYILSANINRRHLSKGQRAMATALIYPEAKKEGRGKKSNLKLHFTKMHLSRARMVLKHAEDLANAVLTGSQSLNSAYDIARQRKQEAESYQASFDRLKKEAPDFADMVTDEQMSLSEAIAAMEQRKKERRQAQISIADRIGTLISYSSTAATDKARHQIVDFMLNDTEVFEEFSHSKIDDAISDLKQTSENCEKLVALLEKRHG